ncbi:MAG: NAD(+) diphosphatase [Proteobacteria bacterium]|nr:MAG: NAD(+) diphosphatase [Pseudomonadota bacterium]
MDHHSRSLLNTFSAQPLDRAAHQRKDKRWLAEQEEHPNARFLVLNNHNIVTDKNRPLILSQAQRQQIDIASTPGLLGLSVENAQAYPVYKINSQQPDIELAPLLKAGEFADTQQFDAVPLRKLAPHLDNTMASMCAYASVLNHWHETTRFCTRCGTGLQQKEGGLIQQCNSEDCRHIEFPRINSAVIMRITHSDKILLARQDTWPERRFSVLAGFVEVGETLESAVQREVYEEVKIRVENIQYQSSQPWPFPNSLMLGYSAEAINTDFELEQDDIAEALWLTADELRKKILGGCIIPPSNLSISYQLINDWFAVQTGQMLSEYQPSSAWQD